MVAVGLRPLRVVSYNICGFGAGFGVPNVEAVTATYGRLRGDIRRLQADVVCLQEARRLPLRDPEGIEHDDSLTALAADLGMELHFAHATPGFERFGNALLIGNRLCVLGCTAIHLDGGSVVKTAAGSDKRIIRCCLAARLAMAGEGPGGGEVVPGEVEGQPLGAALKKFAIMVTHWDHMAEAERLMQAECLLSRRDELTGGLPHLLVGDMNAVKRSDYTEAMWSALEDRHSQRGWTAPEDSRALAVLEAQGYTDLLEDSLSKAPPSTARFTAPRDPPLRVDYAYASPDWATVAGQGGGLGATAWIDTSATGSDHLPLVVDAALP